jgi:diguanylate cyclase
VLTDSLTGLAKPPGGIVLGPDAPRLTASFGVVEHRPADAWRDLLTRAETALVRAKRAGRNRCEVA